MDLLELKDQFENLVARRFEIHHWDSVLRVNDRFGFTTPSYNVLAWECDQALEVVEDQEARRWIEAVKAKAIELNAKYASRGMETKY